MEIEESCNGKYGFWRLGFVYSGTPFVDTQFCDLIFWCDGLSLGVRMAHMDLEIGRGRLGRQGFTSKLLGAAISAGAILKTTAFLMLSAITDSTGC